LLNTADNTPYFVEKLIEDGVKLFGIYNRATLFTNIESPQREICDENVISIFNNIIDEFQPDIINFHNFLGLSFEMVSVAKRRNIITTFTTHNYHILDPKLYICNSDLVP